MRAAQKGHGGVVGALLEHGGAELDAVDSDGNTALMLAARGGQAAVAAQKAEAAAALAVEEAVAKAASPTQAAASRHSCRKDRFTKSHRRTWSKNNGGITFIQKSLQVCRHGRDASLVPQRKAGQVGILRPIRLNPRIPLWKQTDHCLR